jgi:hypothetical protein
MSVNFDPKYDLENGTIDRNQEVERFYPKVERILVTPNLLPELTGRNASLFFEKCVE